MTGIEKVRLLEQLREREQIARHTAATLRAGYDFAPPRSKIAEVIAEEARAGAFAEIVDLVEGVPF